MSRKIIQVIRRKAPMRVLADDGTVWKLMGDQWYQIDLPTLPPDPIVVARNERINKAFESYYSLPKCPICGCRVSNEMDICDDCKQSKSDKCIHCGRVFSNIEKEMGECANCNKQI